MPRGGDKGRCWALDPIDGTKGFLRGGQYAVCLGFMVDGKVQVGVMGCPNLPHDASSPKPKEGEFGAGDKRKDLGTLFIAVRGQGAFQRRIEGGEEQKISMRSIQSLSEASFCESVEAGHSSHGTNARIAELLGITAPSVRMDSQAKYASLSRGDGDVYLRLPVGDGSYIERSGTTPPDRCSSRRRADACRTSAARSSTLASDARCATTAASWRRTRMCMPR